MTDGARPSPRQVIDAVSVNAASTHAGCRSMRRHGSPKGLSLLGSTFGIAAEDARSPLFATFRATLPASRDNLALVDAEP